MERIMKQLEELQIEYRSFFEHMVTDRDSEKLREIKPLIDSFIGGIEALVELNQDIRIK